MDGKGYTLPEDVQPEKDACLIVWYPDAVEYRRALIGSIAGLAQWVQWEKDGTNRAALAADRWKDALIRTLEQKFDCEILEHVDEDGNMAININLQQDQRQDCGCGGGSTTVIPCSDWRPVDVPQFNPDIGIDDLPSGGYDDGTGLHGFGTREEYDNYKCQLAGNMAHDFVETIGNMQTISGAIGVTGGILIGGMFSGASVVGAAITGLMAVGMSASGAVVALLAIFGLMLSAGTGLFLYFGHVYNELLPLRPDIRCGLFRSSTPAQARQVFVDYTNEAVAAAAIGSLENGNFFLVLLFELVDLLIPNELLSALFEPVVALLQQERNYDCSGCGEVEIAFLPFSTTYTYELDNGWSGGVGTSIANPDGRRSDGTDLCAQHNLCQSSVRLTFSTSDWATWLHRDFAATAESMKFRVRTFTSNYFAPDLIVRVRVPGGPIVVSSTTDPPTGIDELEIEATGLVVGDSYRIDMAGNSRLLLSCDLVG